MSDDNLLQLPRIQGADSQRTPVSDKKRESLEKRLIERVHLVDRQYAENGDIQGFCPMHEDAVASNKPSARFNPTYNYWVCFAPKEEMGCAEQGANANLDKMLRKLKGSRVAGNDNVRSIGTAKSAKKSTVPEISEKQSVDFCSKLQSAPGLLAALEQRRLWDAETVQSVGIGVVDEGWMQSLANKPRFTIPVYDSKGKYQGCRIYDALGNAGASDNKFFWSGGTHDKDAVLRPSRRRNLAERVVIMEGEPDAILAQQDFRGQKKRVDFVSGTRGSKVGWPVKANSMLQNRTVYICLDNDQAGDEGAKKLLESLKVGDCVQDIYLIRIPESKGVKDWTDYRRQVVTDQKVAVSTMLALMDDADHVYSRSAAEAERYRRAHPPQGSTLEPVRIEDAGTIAPDAPGGIAEVVLLGRADKPYLLESDVKLACARDKGKKCDLCPLGMAFDKEDGHGEAQLNYYPHDTSILGLVDASDEQKLKKFRKDSGAKCPDIEHEVKSRVEAFAYLVDDAESNPANDGKEPRQHLMFIAGAGDPDSTSSHMVHYKSTGFWKDNSSVLLSWYTEDLGSDLDNFKMPEKTHKILQKLMHDGATPREKLEEIAADYAWNVTNIYGQPRNLLHILVDLVYHSIQRIPFEAQKAMKGWMDVMVMGDSHTGKSATTRELARFYDAGGVVNGGSISRSGLLGGMAQSVSGSKFMFSKKGAMPRNNRGILTIEESHKLATRKENNLIAQMADARDNGEFNLALINDMTFKSETRLLWIANPPGTMSRHKVLDFPHGAASAITEMMGGRENVTRLTFALGISDAEVSSEQSQRRDEYERPARFSGKHRTMRMLLKWAWSRRPDQIEWVEGAEQMVRRRAARLAAMVPDDFPIASPQDTYAKVARVAAAIAARVYSTPDGERLVIQKRHVKAAYDYLREVYSMDSLGVAKMHRMGVQAEEAQETNKGAVTQILVEKQAIGFCNLVSQGVEFDVNSIAGTTGMTAYDAQQIISVLQRGSYLISSDGRRVRATRNLITLADEAVGQMDRTGSGKTVKAKSARIGNPLPSPPRS